MVAGVTGILPTEIFNQTSRPAAYMTAGSLMWLNLFIIGMIFPFLVVRTWKKIVLISDIFNKITIKNRIFFSSECPLCVFLQSGLGQYCFVPFGAVCLLTALYIQMVLPETKGKTISMITKEFYRLNYRGQVKMDVEGKHAQYQLGEIFHSTAL